MIWKFYIEDVSEVQTEVPNPVGWADAVFKFRRDRDLHGVFFDYSVPLKFHGTGYDIIKAAYDADGVEAYLRVIIQVQCSPTDDFEEFYAARLNFSKVQFLESDVCFVEMVLEDDSCLSMFNNRQDQDVELQSLTTLDGQSMEAYDKINTSISLPSKTILKTDKWLYQSTDTPDTENATRTSTGQGLQEFEPYMWVKSPDNFNELGGINEDYEPGDSDTIDDVPPVWTAQGIPGVVNPAWVFSVRGKINLSITGFLDNVTLDGCDPLDKFGDVHVSLQFLRFRPSDSSFSLHTIDTTIFSGCHTTLNEDLDFTFDGAFPSALLTGDEVKLFWRVQVLGGEYSLINVLDPSEITINFTITDTVESFFEVTLETSYSATDARLSLVNESFSRIVESITDKCLRVKSDYFGRTDSQPYVSAEDGCGSLEAITNGFLIRRNADATHKISFKKLFDGLNAIHNLGVGMEDDTDKGITYSWDISEIIALTDGERICDLFNIIINGSPTIFGDIAETCTGLSTITEIVDYLTGLGFGTFLLSGSILSVTSDEVFGIFSEADFSISITPSISSGVPQRLRIERSEYFYNDTFIMNCDKVPEIKRTAITDEHYSIYEFGYQKWEAEEYNGLDEFNTSRKYRTSLSTIKNTLSKISSLIASGYAIEITRQQFATPTKDWRYDNDDFIICLKRVDDTIVVEQGNIDSPANLIDPPTVYNFRISPNRNALRHLQKVLASYVDPAIAGSLFFMSGTGNTSAEGLLEDGCVYEDAVLSEQKPEISVPTLSDENNGLPIYVPQLWEFRYAITIAQWRAIKANPNGIISVRYGQQQDFHDCYIREIEYEPNKNTGNDGNVTFRLLPSYPFTTTRFILQQSGFYILQQNGGKIIWR